MRLSRIIKPSRSDSSRSAFKSCMTKRNNGRVIWRSKYSVRNSDQQSPLMFFRHSPHSSPEDSADGPIEAPDAVSDPGLAPAGINLQMLMDGRLALPPDAASLEGEG